MGFSSRQSSGGEGEDGEGRALDMASVVVPSVMGSVLLMGIVIYLIRLCYKKYYWKGYPAADDHLIPTHRFDDIESLTEDNRSHDGENGYGADNAFTTITGLSDTNDRDSSAGSPSLSLRSSFYSIGEDRNDGSFRLAGGNAPAYLISREAQTDRDPTVEHMKNYKRDRPPIPNSDQKVYMISSIHKDFPGGLPDGSRSELLECFNEACVVSLDQDCSSSDKAGPTPTSKSPLMHFDNFEKFAEYVDPRKQAPLPILKPILDNISSSSGHSLPATSSSSSLSAINEKSNTEQSSDDGKTLTVVSPSSQWKRKGNSFVSEPPKRVKNFPISFEIRDRIEAEKARLAVQLKNTGRCDLRRLDICEESLNHITMLEDLLLSSEKSRLPEGLTFMKGVWENCLLFLQEAQQTTLDIRIKSIRLAQQLLQFRPTNGDKGLVIGVDATPTLFGGYCVNLAERKLQFYIVDAEATPWPVVERMNPDEFEMRNFLFALCLWHREIEEVKTFQVYTDNWAVWEAKSNRNKHGLPVLNLLDHFRQCHGATPMNVKIYVNRVKDLVSFAKYIQPADDLSRLEVKKCVDFLCEQYSVPKENVTRIHWRKMVKKSLKLQKTPLYKKVLDEVNSFMQTLSCEHRMGDKENLESDPNSSSPDRSPEGSTPRLGKGSSPSHSPVCVGLKRSPNRKKKQNRRPFNSKKSSTLREGAVS